MRVSENRVLREIFVVERNWETVDCRRLHSGELHYTSHKILCEQSNQGLSYGEGHAAFMGRSNGRRETGLGCGNLKESDYIET